jgi:erythromycin esterase-like protein
MYKNLVIIFYFLMSNYVFAQSRQELAGNRFVVTPISNIYWNNFYSETIKSISSAINDKVIVLSENDHGNGLAIEAQCMILKNLIDSNKIDVLFIESSWISVNDIVEILKTEGVNGITKTKEFMRDYGLKYWVDNGFWDYICKKIIENKIKLYGFDIDGISQKSIEIIFNEAENLAITKNFHEENPVEYESIKSDYKYFGGWGLQSVFYKKNYIKHKNFIDPLIKYYFNINNVKRSSQWKSILDLFYWMSRRSEVLKENKYSNQIETDRQGVQFNAVRDSLMAEILYSYHKENKNAKTVAIMSAYHSLKYPEEIKELQECCLDSKVKSMGEILTKKYKLNFYNVCFISSTGRYGIDYLGHGKYAKIKKPIAGSIEYDLTKLDYKFCFIDFNNSKIKSFYMNIFFEKYFMSDWSKNFSAAFFIKEMKPLVFKNLLNK